MTTAPNAKCQRVLVLAECLVYFVFANISLSYGNEDPAPQIPMTDNKTGVKITQGEKLTD